MEHFVRKSGLEVTYATFSAVLGAPLMSAHGYRLVNSRNFSVSFVTTGMVLR